MSEYLSAGSGLSSPSAQTSIAEVILLVCALTHECIFGTGYSDGQRSVSFQITPTGHYRYCSTIFCVLALFGCSKRRSRRWFLALILLEAEKGGLSQLRYYHNLRATQSHPVRKDVNRKSGAWLAPSEILIGSTARACFVIRFTCVL